jgi:predicted flap endonuclease-1-like 5' DNA nuclease
VIWHFFEVWVLMLVAFAVGCPVGALSYDLLAKTPLGRFQEALGDRVGDVVDGVKSRLGLGPVWRPEYRRIVEQPETVLSPYRPIEPPASPRHVPEPAEWQPPRLIAADSEGFDGANGEIEDMPAAEIESDIQPPIGSLPALPAPEGMLPKRPAALVAPRNGVPDDLQRIAGIGERNERRLNELGIYHFGQIAAWTPAEILWVAQQLAFPDRIERDDWVGQATILASGGETGFVKSADRRRARRLLLRDTLLAEPGDGAHAENDAGGEMVADLEEAVTADDVAADEPGEDEAPGYAVERDPG